jgi:aspartate aminotransferase, cytoplasmic
LLLFSFVRVRYAATGADPTDEEWKQVLDVCIERKLLPLFDNAYQGFASGDLHHDAAAVRLFVRAGIDVLACQSFAKNAGLYGERIGAFTVVSAVPGPVAAIRSQLSRVIRGLYSSPPKHGAAVMAAILGDEKLFAEWQAELVVMSDRIKLMRRMLKVALDENGAPGNWDRITSQIGMFSYTGLTSQQVKFMREKYHIYMTTNGRISMAGLTEPTVQYVADAMRDAVISVVKQD